VEWPAAPDRWPLSALVDAVRWRRSMVLAWVALALGMALVYLAITPASYTATATLLTDTKRSPPSPTESAPDTGVDTAVVDSQVELIRSDRIALAVIDKLHLADDPEFNGEGGSSWLGWLTGGGSGTGPLAREELRRQNALGNFKRALRVVRVGRSYVTAISFTSLDRGKAAAAANAVAQAYITDQLSAKIETTQRAGDWMEQRIKQLHKKTTDAAKAIEEFKSRSSSIDPNANTASGRDLEELSAALTKARADETLLNRLSQLIQQQSFVVPEARVVGEAAPPLQKSAPKTLLVLLLAVLSGGALGLTTAVAREHLERLVRTPAQLAVELGIRSLGVVPVVEPPLGLLSPRRRRGPLVVVDRSPGTSRRGSSRQIALATETLKAVRLAIAQSARREKGVVVGLVSALPGEGKTTLAYNLAVLAAQGYRRVLLIDGNLHQPTLTHYLAPDGAKGLMAVLGKEADLAHSVTAIDGFEFLGEPQGAAAHAADLLSSPAMQNLIDAARHAYDYVIVDLPAMLHHVDAVAIAHVVDAFVLVAEWGRASLYELEQVIGSSDEFNGHLVGAVINKSSVWGHRASLLAK